MPIGDAAYAIDPIAGTGISRGLAMAEAAADSVVAFLATGDTAPLEATALQNAEAFVALDRRRQNLYFQPGACPGRFWQRRRSTAL